MTSLHASISTSILLRIVKFTPVRGRGYVITSPLEKVALRMRLVRASFGVLCARGTSGDIEVPQATSLQIIYPTMNPNSLSFASAFGPSILNGLCAGEIVNLRLDIFLDDDRKCFCMRDGRKMERSGKPCKRFQPPVESGFHGQRR